MLGFRIRNLGENQRVKRSLETRAEKVGWKTARTQVDARRARRMSTVCGGARGRRGRAPGTQGTGPGTGAGTQGTGPRAPAALWAGRGRGRGPRGPGKGGLGRRRTDGRPRSRRKPGRGRAPGGA